MNSLLLPALKERAKRRRIKYIEGLILKCPHIFPFTYGGSTKVVIIVYVAIVIGCRKELIKQGVIV